MASNYRETRNHRTLVEPDVIEFTAHIPRRAHEPLDYLWREYEELARILGPDEPKLQFFGDWIRGYVRMSPAVEGRRADQLVETIRAERPQQPNAASTLTPDYKPSNGSAAPAEAVKPARRGFGLG